MSLTHLRLALAQHTAIRELGRGKYMRRVIPQRAAVVEPHVLFVVDVQRLVGVDRYQHGADIGIWFALLEAIPQVVHERGLVQSRQTH